MASREDEISKAFVTLREMLLDRLVARLGPTMQHPGDAEYDAFAMDLYTVSPEDVIALSKSRIAFHLDLMSCQHRIIFDFNERYKISTIKRFMEVPDGITHVIVVIKENNVCTAPVKTTINSYPGIEVEFFKLSELQYNVSKHSYVPQHTPIVDDRQIQEVINKYNLKDFERPSYTACTTTVYRCCMKIA